MVELRPGGSLEGDDPAALRIDAGEDRPDQAVLARRVDTLKDDEDAPAPLGPESRLEQVELLEQLGEALLRLALARQAEGVLGVAPGEVRGLAGLHDQLVQQRGHYGAGTSSWRCETSISLLRVVASWYSPVSQRPS